VFVCMASVLAQEVRRVYMGVVTCVFPPILVCQVILFFSCVSVVAVLSILLSLQAN